MLMVMNLLLTIKSDCCLILQIYFQIFNQRKPGLHKQTNIPVKSPITKMTCNKLAETYANIYF